MYYPIDIIYIGTEIQGVSEMIEETYRGVFGRLSHITIFLKILYISKIWVFQLYH